MKFTDRTGREWNFELNFGSVVRVKNDGHNLMSLEEEFAGGKRINELMKDDSLVIKWIWWFIQADAVKAGVTEEAFYAALGGLSFASALRAFWGEYQNFTRSPAICSAIREQTRLELEMEQRASRAMARAVKLANEQAAAIFESLSDENIEKQYADAVSSLQKRTPQPSETTTNSPPPEPSETSGVLLAS